MNNSSANIFFLYISDTQQWKLTGTKPYQNLINKAGLWKSPDSWKFHDDGTIRIIQDLTRNLVLGIQEGTRSVSPEYGETWRRRKFNNTHFTLEATSLALTKNTAGDFVESKNIYHKFNKQD